MKKAFPKRHRPGSSWRVLFHDYLGRGQCGQAHNIESHGYGPTEFDELVIDAWFHLEQMNTRHWWMRVGELDINVTVGEHGEAKYLYVMDGHDDKIWEKKPA